MTSPVAFIQLAEEAAKVSELLRHVDAAKYEKDVAGIFADGKKLLDDLKALGAQIEADMKVLGIEPPKV